MANGGFIRMKNISLTYDFEPKLIRHIGLNTASLKLDATNLFLIYSDSKLNGQDPEFVNAGGVPFGYLIVSFIDNKEYNNFRYIYEIH